MREFKTSAACIEELSPTHPVYCIYPDTLRSSGREFLDGFPGRTLYAVKANNHPLVISTFWDTGIRDFDCASLTEIAGISAEHPDANCYFMNPVRMPGDAETAASQFGVRNFVVDHLSALNLLADEIDLKDIVVFARLGVHHDSAVVNLSTKFGADPPETAALLQAIAASGAEPALAYNVGSGVTSPEAYEHSFDLSRQVLRESGVNVRTIDVGGGFPRPFPEHPVPPLQDFFDVFHEARSSIDSSVEFLVEPGRALSAPGMSSIVRVLLKKDERLYLNDGMYGIFWELRFKGHKKFPVRAFRGGELMTGETKAFQLFGPTCDSWDKLPAAIELPANIEVGDYLEFGSMGAYALHGRSDFNGFHSDNVVAVMGSDTP